MGKNDARKRDNEVAAEAMGKNVTGRASTDFYSWLSCLWDSWSYDDNFRQSAYSRNVSTAKGTFLIWVMVIVGGSGNNLGAVLGGFIIWFLWVQVEPIGQFLMIILTSGLADDSTLKTHLMDSVAHMRLLTMGLLFLLVLNLVLRTCA